MRRALGTLCMALALSACTLFQEQQTSPQKAIVKKPSEGAAPTPVLKSRLAVLPFLDADEKRPESLRQKSRETFVRDLIRSKQFVVIDANELKVQYSDFIKKGDYDYSRLSPQAQSLGIPVLLEGKILQIRARRQADEVGLLRQVKSSFEVQVRLRLISTKSQKDMMNVTKTVSLNDSGVRIAENATVESLIQTDPELIEKLVSDSFLEFQDQIRRTLEKVSWEGRIAAIQGERYFLNVGQISGLSVGDVLKVTEDGDDVYDPQTGNFIGRASGRVKGTLEVVSYFGHDGAIAVLHSGAGFKENDRIELY